MFLNKKLLNIFKKTKTTSDNDTYTCNYINDKLDAIDTSLTNLSNSMKFSNWINLYSSGNNVVKYRYNAFMVEIRIYMQDTHTSDITTNALPSACRPSETVSTELTGEGLNYANLYTDGKIILHNNNAYAGGTMTYTLTNQFIDYMEETQQNAMGLKLNKKLLDIFKKTKTTSDEYSYTCSYINDLEDNISNSINLKQNKIKTTVKSLNTDGAGNAITGLNTNDHILLSVYQRSGTSINGFVSIYSYNGNYYIHTSNFDGTALSGTADFELVYIDR